MLTFYNSSSRPLIYPKQFNGHNLEISNENNLALVKNHFPVGHLFNLPHYFSSDKPIKLILDGFNDFPNVFTMYLNIHPLQEINLLKFDELSKFYRKSRLSFSNAGYNYVIDLENFTRNRLSKSIKQKMQKYPLSAFSNPSANDFYDVFKKFFNNSSPYEIDFINQEYIAFYQASFGNDSVFMMIGEPKISESNCAEYLFSCSNNSSARNLTSAALFQLIFILKKNGYKFFNLGGGVKPGDNLEKFKSWFGGVAMPSVKCRFASSADEFTTQGGGFEEAFFPTYKKQYTK